MGERVLPGQGKRSRHLAAIAAGTEPRFHPPESPYTVLKCGKCGEKMSEVMATEHLLKCQPYGVKCGKCGQPDILPEKFMVHFKGCNGKRPEVQTEPVVDDAEMRRRENESILAAMGQKKVLVIRDENHARGLVAALRARLKK